MIETSCRWADGQRLTTRHLRDCESAGCAGCAGCEPCLAEHCRCGRHLRDSEPLTCARCVGKVRQDLKRIDELCLLAPVAAAETGGVDTAVMVLAGPVARHSTHAARRAWAHGGGLCTCLDCPDDQPMPSGPVCEKVTDKQKPCAHHVCQRRAYRPTCPGLATWLEYADDERHPLWVLGTWDMLITEHLGHAGRTGRVTVHDAADYLARNLTDLGQARDFGFDELASEVRDCREHVEQVMGVATWSQKGAPCPRCNRAMQCTRGTVESADRWGCPTRGCESGWTQAEYDTHVYRTWLANADRLTAAQVLAQYRVPEGTLRRWATTVDPATDRPLVARHGYDGERRQLYDVADIKRMRDVDDLGRVS